ncbi:MAG: hypothetical protein IH986_06705 [Planctomycetes bacterium]|nr:hypothetical protein [Planctomycetota bacterium]
MPGPRDSDDDRLLPRRQSRAGIASCLLFALSLACYGGAALVIWQRGAPSPLMPDYSDAFVVVIALFAGMALGFSSNLMGFSLALLALGRRGVRRAAAVWGAALNGGILATMITLYLVGKTLE